MPVDLQDPKMSGRRLSIAVLGPNYGLGGSQTAFRRLVAFLVAERHSVGVVSIRGDQAMPFEGVAFEVVVPLSNRFPAVMRKGVRALQAALRCRRARPEVFISMGLNGQGNLIARALGQGAFRVCQDLSHGRSAGDRRLMSAMGSFDAIAPQAPSMETVLRREANAAFPIRWLPCFPDPPAEGVTARLAPQDGIRLAYFGRIERYKGINLVLQALADAPALRSVCFDVWGGGGDVSDLSAMAVGLGLSDRVRFRGRYPDGRAGGELMASYHALVMPTTGNEGLPLILLEAMAYGLPLLATDVAAIPDCCDGNPDAVMVNPTVNGLRVGLERLVGGLQSGEFSAERQQQFYAERFSYEAMATRWRTFLLNPRQFFA